MLDTILKRASSTPSSQRTGQVVALKLAKLARYEFNLRSFHPGKTFGWSGLNYEGDARGFSLGASGASGAIGAEVTSRIWHRFKVNALSGEALGTETESNDSGKIDGDHTHYDGVLKPKGGAWPILKKEGGSVTTLHIDGGYAGENHAFFASAELKKTLGVTFVPSLDVSYKIVITIDRVSKHMDIVTYVTGDGFPNCEAFIVDAAGTAIFLGVHVRKGAALFSLWGDKKYPMIASAIRLDLDDNGNFNGLVANELKRKKQNKEKLEFHPITEWNNFFLNLDPSAERWMWPWQEPMLERPSVAQ
jgi:hypothetical protein